MAKTAKVVVSVDTTELEALVKRLETAVKALNAPQPVTVMPPMRLMEDEEDGLPWLPPRRW